MEVHTLTFQREPQAADIRMTADSPDAPQIGHAEILGNTNHRWQTHLAPQRDEEGHNREEHLVAICITCGLIRVAAVLHDSVMGLRGACPGSGHEVGSNGAEDADRDADDEAWNGL
jgi:hypothetical protein